MNDIPTVAVLGAGNRGDRVYGRYIKEHPSEIRVVAIAEPEKSRRENFASEHQIKKEYCFRSWEGLLARERLADGIIIATMDTMHLQPALKAIKKGYKILLEKPIAPTWQETMTLVREARKMGGKILVAHVLRYTPFYRKLKEILSSGVIGRIRLVDHIENIGYFHFAHSYVRGNWRNTEVAAPIILAKSCHDLDLLYWLLGKKAWTICSSGSLEYFTAENKPVGAGERCQDCSVEENCPYSALKIYLNDNQGWPVSVITDDLSREGRIKALEVGPYGRCVYSCDNNIPEVQTVQMTMEDNLEVNFALTAFSSRITRRTIFFGTRGEIKADFEDGLIFLDKYGEGQEVINITAPGEGHGGGDHGLMEHFLQFLKGEEKNNYSTTTTIEESLESHLMSFAAEKARKNRKIVDLNEFRVRT